MEKKIDILRSLLKKKIYKKDIAINYLKNNIELIHKDIKEKNYEILQLFIKKKKYYLMIFYVEEATKEFKINFHIDILFQAAELPYFQEEDIPSYIEKSKEEKSVFDEKSPLFVLLAGDYSEDLIKYFIEKEENISEINIDHDSVLLLAFYYNHSEEIIKLIINKGANINQQSYQCNYPLLLALEKGNIRYSESLIKMLINKETDINNYYEGSIASHLNLALEKKYSMDIISLLINERTDVNFLDENNNISLFCALKNNFSGELGIFLDEETDINHVNNNGENVFLIISRYVMKENKLDALKFLDYCFDIKNVKNIKNIIKYILDNDNYFFFVTRFPEVLLIDKFRWKPINYINWNRRKKSVDYIYISY